ncbi:MAG TPA: leucine-rich repeat domain-containing protein [Bacteroidales bacterium]|nr:leucine-rich repeat domain-containing protein [Bacteroidales bacterium]
MKKIGLTFLFLLWGFSGSGVFAQLLSAEELKKKPIYTNLSTAIKNPEKVYRLSLKKQKLKEIPESVFLLKNLQELDISRNKIKAIPKEIAQLKNLEILDASLNKIDTVYAEIGELVNIKELNLSQNFISYLPSSIGNLNKMVLLDLWKNYISVFPFEISNLQKTLKVVDLRVNMIKDEEQEEISNLLPETKISFSLDCNCN